MPGLAVVRRLGARASAVRRRASGVMRAASVLFVARPALADALEDENSFCVLLGLTLAGVLGGWVFLFRSKGLNRVPTDAAMLVLAVPALFVTVAVFFPAPERLAVVAPALPLIVAGTLRAYLTSRARRQDRAVGPRGTRSPRTHEDNV